MDTPVVFLIFNRPDTTKRVFEAIRKAQPSKLLVVADAPRSNRLGEAEQCTATRAVIEQVDWNCQVFTNYSEVNMGCKRRVSSGLDWAFSIVDEAIILEDDCLPHPSFFRFCEELLDYYRHKHHVMSICGQNVQFGRKRSKYSYYFSRYFHCWGWATWKRALQTYDVEIKSFPEALKKGLLENRLENNHAVEYWKTIFDRVHRGEIDTWDHQMQFNCWEQGGVCVIPQVNLISNIGFGSEATHTKADKEASIYAEMALSDIDFPLRYPPYIIEDKQADRFTQDTLFDITMPLRIRSKINRIFGIRKI